MLFDTLDKLKRNSIISAILLIAFGAVILICPRSYIGLFTIVFSIALGIFSVKKLFNRK